MNFKGDDYVSDHIRRFQEEAAQGHTRFEGSKRAKVRKIATEVFEECGYSYNTISVIRLDNRTWQIEYDNELPFKERPVLRDLIQEQLELAFPEGPYEVKLVGLGYHPR